MRGALGRLVDGRVEACSEALVERAKLAPTLSAKALVDDVSSPTGVSSPTDRSARQRSPRQFRRRIALIDCGAKHNIVRSLTAYGAEVVPLSWRASFDEVAAARADGVVVSNGPGDPEMAGPAVGLVRSLLEEGVPTLGICLGHQVLGMAAGATTSRLRFGHHGGNHPVRDLTTGRIHITSQNHEFQVDAGSVPASSGFVVSMVNLNDGSVEGLAHRVLPVFSVQYHPEGCPGPQDNQYVFERFLEMVERPISGSSALARDIT
jgi:carbamoyl-phosphate synthase small subunit